MWERKRGKKQMEQQRILGDDAAHRRIAPTSRCLLCLCCPIVSVPINLLACCARAGKDGWIQNDRHGLVTWEVRGGFNRSLRAVGTLAVSLNEEREGLWVYELDGESVPVCLVKGGVCLADHNGRSCLDSDQPK